jgi:hypothetical protein
MVISKFACKNKFDIIFGMNKKTLIIILVILLIVGGLCYGASSWLKGRSIQQAFQDMTKGSFKQDLGTGTTTNGEVIKTPEDIFNETKEVVLSSNTLPIFTENVKPEIEKVFGKSKVISYGKYYDYEGSFKAVLKVPRLILPEDLTKLEEFYAKEGFETTTNEVTADSGTLIMSNKGTEIEFSFFGDDQNISIWYTPAQN